MSRLGKILSIVFIAFGYAPRAQTVDAKTAFAREAVGRIFAARPLGGRAPLLHLSSQMPNSCSEIVKALEAEAKAVTHVYSHDTAEVRSERHAFDIFNTPPGPSAFGSNTPFENFLDNNKFGGVIIFAGNGAHENAVVAARVARIYKEGKHVSQAGHFRTTPHAFILQSGDAIMVAKRGTLRATLPPSLWSGTINFCKFDLVDGEAFARRVAEEDTPIETPVADAEPSLQDFAQEIVTRIGQSSGPLLLPPLVLLTPAGQSCGLLAATIHEVAQRVTSSYVVFAEGKQAFDNGSFLKFLETEKRGLIVARAATVKMQTQFSTAQIGRFILSQWHDGPKGGFDMSRFGYVLETTPDAELRPGLTIERLLNRAHAAKEVRGCRFSLIPGLSILSLLKEHKRCDKDMGTAEST